MEVKRVYWSPECGYMIRMCLGADQSNYGSVNHIGADQSILTPKNEK